MKNGRNLLSLLKAGPNVHQQNEHDEILFHKVMWDCDLSVVNTLGDADVDNAISNTSTSVLHRAAEAGKVKTV
ncbi:hypothetical protein BDV34DRAFT_199270, partial [Aspergillus parasiticus]